MPLKHPTATCSTRCGPADRDRFLAALFAPEPQRRGLLALLAFDHELARTRTVTREPMLARIRLEWWREAVAEAAGEGKPRAQPIVELLSETVRRHGLPQQRLLDLIDAREEEIEGALDVVARGPCAGRPATRRAGRHRRSRRGRRRVLSARRG